ncbi:MAG: dTMP kinase [Phycisphaerae bacterium]|nr:dTMP kinase [Phycisphaerae bacterium]
MTDLADKLAGRFLVLDGPDGCGKSTQLTRLAAWLREQGADVLETRDPGGTPVGDRIREVLLDAAHAEMTVACETLLYMASRAQLWDEVIAPALDTRRCVLCDRWVSATVAYQGAGGADAEDILAVYRTVLGDVGPDLTVVLDLDAETALARTGAAVGRDRMERKNAGFHRTVRELFLRQAQYRPDRFAVVDAAGDADAVACRIRETIIRWAEV